MAMGAPPPDDVAAIRALRAESNAGLAARDAARVTAAFAEDIHSISGGGELIDGRTAVAKVYADELAPDGDFISGLRTPGRIAVNRPGDRAAEPGRWRWAVKTPMGEAAFSGDYLAGWVKRGGQWRLQSELYVTTGCTGPGCRL
jgi:ketosteroid isomerase-like protein